MPANQGQGGAEWSPQPDFTVRDEPLQIDESIQHYEPASVAECAEFFDYIGFPNLDCYDGHPQVRASLAKYTAEHLLTPGIPIVRMMELYEQVESDPARRQDFEHDREWKLIKIEKELAARKAEEQGRVIEAAGRFALGSQLNLKTGKVVHRQAHTSVPSRIFG